MSLFDDLLLKALKYVNLDKTYKESETFRQFVRYGISITTVYWLGKAPLIWLLTELFHLHYTLSGFLVGLLVTLIGFFVEKYFVFRRDKK